METERLGNGQISVKFSWAREPRVQTVHEITTLPVGEVGRIELSSQGRLHLIWATIRFFSFLVSQKRDLSSPQLFLGSIEAWGIILNVGLYSTKNKLSRSSGSRPSLPTMSVTLSNSHPMTSFWQNSKAENHNTWYMYPSRQLTICCL